MDTVLRSSEAAATNNTSTNIDLSSAYLDDLAPRPLKNNSGHYYSTALFFETIKDSNGSPIIDSIGPRPIFTLKVYNHTIPRESIFYREGHSNLLRSLYQLYLDSSDPLEFKFATKVFGDTEGWAHWEYLSQSEFFQPYLKRMRDALRAKIESEAFSNVRRIAATGIGPQALQASKWLLDRVKEKPKAKRGRPSKEEIEDQLKQDTREAKELSADLQRLGL